MARMKKDQQNVTVVIDDNIGGGKSPRMSLDKGSLALKEQRRDSSIAFRTRSRLKLRGNRICLESCVSMQTSKMKKTLSVENGRSVNVDGKKNAVPLPNFGQICASDSDEDWENLTLDKRMNKFLPFATKLCDKSLIRCAANVEGKDCDEDWENLTFDKRMNKFLPFARKLCNQSLIRSATNVEAEGEDLTSEFELESKLKDEHIEIEDEKLNRTKSNTQTQNFVSLSRASPKKCNQIICLISDEQPKENNRDIEDNLCTDDIQLVSNHSSACRLKYLPSNTIKKAKLLKNSQYISFNCYREEISKTPPSTPQHRVINPTSDSPENSPLYDMPPPSTPAQKRARRAKRQIQLERWRKYEEKRGRQERYQRRHKRHSGNEEKQFQTAVKNSVHIHWKPDLEKVYIFSPQCSDYCYD